MSKVSVIMPTYNRAWVIGRAIKSVLNQTFTDFELIIINDGSTDNTKEVLKSFSDQRIKIVDLPVNSGLSHARNEGLKEATGELIAYLDSDNVWYPNYLEANVGEILENTIFAYSGQNLILVGGTKDSPKVLGRKVRNEEFNLDKLVNKGNFIDVNCVVHKRSLLTEVGIFDESLKVLEDWDLFARIAIKYPFGIKHIDNILGEYYFYIPETELTLTNQKWQSWVEDFFGIDKKEGDELTVINKISASLGKK